MNFWSQPKSILEKFQIMTTLGFELVTSCLKVRRANHYTTKEAVAKQFTAIYPVQDKIWNCIWFWRKCDWSVYDCFKSMNSILCTTYKLALLCTIHVLYSRHYCTLSCLHCTLCMYLQSLLCEFWNPADLLY